MIVANCSVSLCTDLLPRDKPVYLMGVVYLAFCASLIQQGYAEDLVVSVALGVDMFDCVYPTRTAVYIESRFSLLILQRFGHAITPGGVLNLRNRIYATDFTPIDDSCRCPCCRNGGWGVTKSLIYHLACKETGCHVCSSVS